MRGIRQKISELIPRPLMQAVHFIRILFSDFNQDNGLLVAAAVSFYVFMSVIPLLLLGTAIIGWLLGSPERAESLIMSTITANAPELASQTEMLDLLGGVIDQVIAGRGVATGIGLLTLLWVGTSVIANLEKAINMVWGAQQRTFLRQRLLALGLLAMMGGLIGISFGITTGINALKAIDFPSPFLHPQGVSLAWQMLGYALPMGLLIGTYTLFYKVVPNASVPWKSAVLAGLFSGTLLFVAQLLFGYYVARFANYSAVYGSLAAVFVLLIWINYSTIVTMLGAEVGSIHAGRRHK